MANRISGEPGSCTQVNTYCRICEATCGLIAKMQNGRIISVEGNRDHIFSRGHFCKKAMGAVEVTYDPDRVTQPLKRIGGPGDFAPISWQQAMDEIAVKLKTIRSNYGAASFATFMGNPPTNSFSAWLWLNQFQKLLGIQWNYSANAEDAAAYQKACDLLYGSGWMLPKPDFWRTDFAIVIGANPFVSHGSLCSEPLMRECLRSVVERGGRVVVIDPRRTETAQAFEHIAINAGSDTWLLLAILNEIVRLNAVDHDFIRQRTTGFDRLAQVIASVTPAVAAEHCGITASVVSALARDFAAAPRAVLYGRTGTCTQRFGTLNNLLQNLICLVTGNIDVPGGMAFPSLPIRSSRFVNGDPVFPRAHSRADGLPSVNGLFPSRALVNDILQPGNDQVRALMMVGGNPVHSSGAAGEGYEAALERLDLHFSLDLYVNETNRHAHYILPVTGMYERADISTKYLFSQLRPCLWATEPVVQPLGAAREEWRIMNDLCRRLGFGGAYANRWLRRLAKLGIAVTPMALMNFSIRTSKIGDGYGRRPGRLSMRKLLKRYPNGYSLHPDLPTGLLAKDRRINLVCSELESEIDRLSMQRPDARWPLRLSGMRELLTHNTWMHNVPSLATARRQHCVHINPQDADELGVGEGDLVEIHSAAGSVRVMAKRSDRMKAGNVALPHGWGHAGGWQRANRAGGVNSNVLAAKNMDDVEAVAGMSILNGIPVRIIRASQEISTVVEIADRSSQVEI